MTKKIILSGFFILILSFINTKAEEKKDIIKISLPNNAAIEIRSIDVNKYELDTAFITSYIDKLFSFSKSSNIEEMLQSAPRFIKILNENSKTNYYFERSNPNPFYELSIEERKIPNKIIASDDFTENLYYLQKHQFQFENKFFAVNILFDEMDQLKSIKSKDMLKVIDSVMQDYLSQKSKHIEKADFLVNYDLEYKKINENYKRANDQIELSLGSSIESVKNTLASSLEATMALSFGSKGITKNKYFVGYEWQYDFSDSNKGNINHFLNIGYTRDFSEDPEKEQSYTFKVGYLLNKNGGLYNEDTFSFSITHRVGKYFDITPKIYFDGAFKNIAPAISVGIPIL